MSKFITNQNIELKYELASLGDRILAFILDGLINGAFLVVLFISIASIPQIQNSAYVTLAFLPSMFYTLLFETLGNGQTLGKKARNIRVIKLDGGSPGFVNYLLRWIVRPVDIILYGAVAIVCIIMSKNAQRLGDIIAGTTVAKIKGQITFENVKTVLSDDHELVFPQVKQLNDKQIELIRKALHMRRDGFSGEGVKELAEKLKVVLKIETKMSDVGFLYTLIKDFEYLAIEKP